MHGAQGLKVSAEQSWEYLYAPKGEGVREKGRIGGPILSKNKYQAWLGRTLNRREVFGENLRREGGRKNIRKSFGARGLP